MGTFLTSVDTEVAPSLTFDLPVGKLPTLTAFLEIATNPTPVG
jgi:hypothetical protein